MKTNRTRGGLTAYGFGCGYHQRFSRFNIEIQLYKDGMFHIRCYDHSPNMNAGKICWHSVSNIDVARFIYNNIFRRLNLIKREKIEKGIEGISIKKIEEWKEYVRDYPIWPNV